MKRSPRHNRVKNLSRPRIVGGAFGSKKKYGPGSYTIRKGVLKNAYGQKFLVYDQAVILSKPISIEAAYIEWAGENPELGSLVGFFERAGDKAREFFKSRRHGGEDPILQVGALIIDRGRVWQPWAQREFYATDHLEAAETLRDMLKHYKNFSEIASTRATEKTGVIGWFCRARTRPYGKESPPIKKRKNAKAKAAKKRSKTLAKLPRMGRRSKTSVRRRTRKHPLARRGIVSRKRKATNRKRSK